MSSLEEVLSAYLAGGQGLKDLSSSLQQSRSELKAHQADISLVMANVPDYLISAERGVWLSSYTVLEERLQKLEDEIRDPSLLKGLLNDLPQLKDALAMSSLSVREAAWAARGPSTHPGVNEIIHLLDRLGDEPTDQLFDMFQAKLEIEFSRFESQAQVYQELPEFIAAVMEELLPEYRDILETLSQISELGDEEVESLYERLEDWGASFSAYDLDFLSKRYSKVPTPVPAVNFALNCQMLYLEELVNEDMVDYAVDKAIEVLQFGSEKFLEEKKLSDVEQHSYDELFADLSSGLESIPEIAEPEELKEAGQEIVSLTARLIQVQRQAESESGSRLDFKSEASE